MKKKVIICSGSIGVIGVIFVIGLLIAFWKYDAEVKKNVTALDDIVQEVTISTEPMRTEPPKSEQMNETESVSDTSLAETEEVTVQAMHDFAVLKETNQDVYAWITMPDTKVDYPILQSETDNKYLDTNIDGSSGFPGCIYTNVCNSKDFDDYITVVYGHNMKNGDMFGSLHNFNDATFFDDYGTFTVETPDRLLTYSLYAAVNYNDKLIPAYYDVKSVAGRDEFIKSLEECRGNSKTHFSDDMEISGEDKVLVLSVCIKGQDDRRYLIVAKLDSQVMIQGER